MLLLLHVAFIMRKTPEPKHFRHQDTLALSATLLHDLHQQSHCQCEKRRKISGLLRNIVIYCPSLERHAKVRSWAGMTTNITAIQPLHQRLDLSALKACLLKAHLVFQPGILTTTIPPEIAVQSPVTQAHTSSSLQQPQPSRVMPAQQPTSVNCGQHPSTPHSTLSPHATLLQHKIFPYLNDLILTMLQDKYIVFDHVSTHYHSMNILHMIRKHGDCMPSVLFLVSELS